MMRTIINKLSHALLVLLLFASCDNGEYGLEESTGGDSEEIRFEIVVATATASSSGAQTRVATSTDGNYTTTWNNGDEIGIYIVKGSGGLQSSGNWKDNVKLTYNNGTWTPATSLYYAPGNEQLHFYAYYPYNSAVTDALNMNISGLTDQSSEANLSKSDLLSAATLNVSKGSSPVQLNFWHALTLVELSVTSGGAWAQMSSEVAVTLEGCAPDVSFNLSTKAANAAGSVKSVKMYRVEQAADADYLTKYTYRALVPTQTVFAGTELFRFSQTQGTIARALSHRPSSNVELYPKQVKPYNITLQPQTSNITYNVGDYYPKNGFPILGVVFEVSNGGKSGKIISLDQKSEAAWGPRTVDEQSAGVGGIRSVSDGLTATKNMIIKYKSTTDFSTKYGAFHWIYQTKNHEDVNGIWYMPAKDEVLAFWNVWNTDQTGFDSKLTAAGGIGVYGYWWTSTESSAQFCHFIGTYWGVTWDYTYHKDYVNWEFITRAIAKF